MSSIADLVEADGDWLDALPRDEAADIRQLLSNNPDELRAAEIWVSSKFAYAAPSAPGEGDEVVTPGYYRNFIQNVRNEVHDFLCKDDRYVGEKKELQKYGNDGRTAIVAAISAAIAPYIGDLAPMSIGVVVLILVTIQRVGLRAWCRTETERRGLI